MGAKQKKKSIIELSLLEELTMKSTRRRFLQTLANSGFAAGCAVPLLADEVALPRLGIEPSKETMGLVRLIDITPREDCPQMLAEQLSAGVPYRELLAAAFMFAVLHDGHHTVYLVHAAHQLTLDAAPEDRVLPLFWAVDNMKEALARARAEQVGPLSGPLPKASQASAEFDAAMQSMDREKAEQAIIALSRSIGPKRAYSRFLKYAGRDNHFIGHIPIGIVSAGRALQSIGWQHAEPVLRYIVRDMYRTDHDLDGQPYEQNLERAKNTYEQLPAEWASAKADEGLTRELFGIMQRGKWWNSNDWIVEQLTAGRMKAGTVWDAVHLFAADLMVRHRLGGRRIATHALHSNTCANALHHAYNHCENSFDRYLTMLQAVSWVTESMLNEQQLGFLREQQITDMKETQLRGTDEEVVDEIFASLPPRIVYTENEDRTGQDHAAQLIFSLAHRSPDQSAFLSASRNILCHKSTINAHDLKFPMAMFEELKRISPTWRPYLLAATVHFMQSSNSVDCPAVVRGIDAIS